MAEMEAQDRQGPAEPDEPDEPDEARDSELESLEGGPSIAGLFLVPLMIVLVAMALVSAIYLLAADRPTIEEYARQLRSPDKAERWQAALNLIDTNRGSADLVPILLEMTNATSDDQSLVQTNWSVSDMIRTPEEREVNLRWYATAALGSIGGERAEAKLLELLDDKDGGVRLYAVHSLGRIGKEEFVIPMTGRLLNDEDKGVRTVAAYALGEMRAEGAKAALKQAFENDPETDVQWNAAIALARLGDDSVRGALEEMRRSDIPSVRTEASRALRLLDRPAAAE
jgi:HEAT repeat protein